LLHDTIASPAQQSFSLLVVCPVPTNDAVMTESEQYHCFIRNGGNAIQKHTSPEAKIAFLPLDLTGSRLITPTGEILTTGKAYHKSNPLSVPWGIVDLYSTLRWVMWEVVTVVESTP